MSSYLAACESAKKAKETTKTKATRCISRAITYVTSSSSSSWVVVVVVVVVLVVASSRQVRVILLAVISITIITGGGTSGTIQIISNVIIRTSGGITTG